MKKSVLIIGGTRFVGRHIVKVGLEQGHDITLFTRGQTNIHLFGDSFANIKHIVGDRRSDIAQLGELLGHKHWDVVIDTCGYIGREVAASTQWLRNRCKLYVFISSVSAYASFAKPNDENSALGRITDVETEVIDGRTYGPLKAHCESIVKAAFGDRALIVRPGLVVGPEDYTDRFTYWVARALRGGTIVAPERNDFPIQYIDARDLARFIWHCIYNAYSGIFNVVTPPGRDTLGDLIQNARDFANVPSDVKWVSPELLEKNAISAWNDMPLWFAPKKDTVLGDMSHFMASSNTKAIEHGLTCASLYNTVDVLANWFASEPIDRQQALKSGLSLQREEALLHSIHT